MTFLALKNKGDVISERTPKVHDINTRTIEIQQHTRIIKSRNRRTKG